MPFRGSRLGSIINSVKHVVDTEGGVTEVNSRSVIANTVTVKSASFDPTEVGIGDKINAFFLSIFIIGTTGAPVTGSINWYIIKLHTAQTGPPNAGNTGPSTLRNQIFHEEKGLAGSGDGTPMAFKGVIVVPKGMRRMRQGDSFEVVIRLNDASQSAGFCLKAIYKSFS